MLAMFRLYSLSMQKSFGDRFRICKKIEYQFDHAVLRNRRESPVVVINRKLSHHKGSMGEMKLCFTDLPYSGLARYCNAKIEN